MKYHNFKRPLAVILASLLTFSSASFLASAQGTDGDEQGTSTTTITYTFRGGSSNDDGTGDYTVDVLANGGLINTGFVELKYDEELYSDVSFSFASNIKDASFYWDVDNTTAGTYGVGFMSAAGLSDDDAGLFADVDNSSDSIAYIDASGNDLVKIGTFTLKFKGENTYATAFTTGNAPNSAVKVETAKYILHEPNGYDTTKQSAGVIESTMKVFSASDFAVENATVDYDGEYHAPDVSSDVAEAFTLSLGEATAKEVKDACTYAIKVVVVSGDGYYDAKEIDLSADFVINRGTGTVDKPADPDSVSYEEGGIDVSTLEFTDWKVTDTGSLGAGTHTVNIEFTGKLDTNIDYSAGTCVTYNEETEKYTATVSFVITPLEGTVPELVTEYTATYDASKTQTIAGYEIKASDGWAWSNNALEIGMTAVETTVVYKPDDTTNYDFSDVEDWDDDSKTVTRTVSVVLNKATGTAPTAPTVTKTEDRLTEVGGKIEISNFVEAGDWTTTVTELSVGTAEVTFIYNKNIDTEHYTYTTNGNVIWDADSEQYTFTVKLTVNKPYLDVVSLVDPDAISWTEDKITYSNFILPEGWKFDDDTAEIKSAGTIKNVKVKYEIPEGYDVDPEDGFVIEDGYIISSVTLTVNKIAGTVTAPTASQTVTFSADKNDKLVTTYVESFGEGWTIVDATKTLAYGDNEIKVQHIADTTNYIWDDYEVGDGVITTNVKVTFNKAVINTTVPPVLKEGTNNKTFVEGGYKYSDFKIATEGWEYANPDATIQTAGTVKAEVKYSIGDDYTVADGSEWDTTTNPGFITSSIDLTVVKADLPNDAASATSVTTTYNSEAQEVVVTKNGNYTGLGEMTVLYKNENGESVDPVDAGNYDVIVTFEDGTNYNGGEIEFIEYLLIKKADVTKNDIIISDSPATYDGTAKKPTVTTDNKEIGVPTVEITEAIDAGEYQYTVSGEATTNYNRYEFVYNFVIEKAKAKIEKPNNLDAVDYTAGGVVASGLTFPEIWLYNDTADKKLDAGEDQSIAVKYDSSKLDTKNYDYTPGEGVDGDSTDGFTSTVTITVNKIAGIVPELTKIYEAKYDNTKTDKKVASYVTIKSDAWKLVDADAVLEYKDDNKYAVEAVVDTKNYTYADVTVGDDKITSEITVKFVKAALPTDAAAVISKTTEYTGSEIEVDVAANTTYNGLGTFTVAYPEGNINVGTYDVTATFAEGDNYLGGTITFTGVLTITKQVLQEISAPTVPSEATVGDEFNGDAGKGFEFVENYVIAEGNNEIKVTKTIAGEYAKNYDYSAAAANVGLTVTTDDTTGDVTLTKTFIVVGELAKGTISFSAIAIVGETGTNDITVTLIPEGGEAVELEVDEEGHIYSKTDYELTAGKYTLKIKKIKYLEAVINFELEGGENLSLPAVNLIPGDIVGGPAGSETKGDGVIDIDDFVIAIRAFDDASSAEVKDAADVNGDIYNNVDDLGYIKANFNKSTVNNSTITVE